MLSIVPNRFAEPKWQAYVIPDKNAYIFSSGRKVKSLYDLKIALTEESEEVISDSLKDNKNDLADWVADILGDQELASALRAYNHRWGLIVALERHMMRTLSLPQYVAKRWLKSSEISFTFVSGEVIHSLEELSAALNQVTEETISFHRERVPNDISKWMMDIIGDYQLAELIEESSNRLQMIHFVEDHIDMLKEAAQDEQ